MPITVTPEEAIPIPLSMGDDKPKDIWEKANYAFNTTQFLIENGLQVTTTEKDRVDARKEFLMQELSTEPVTPAKAIHLKNLLDQYDLEVVRNAVQIRNYIKLKLLELSSSGNDRTELRALELLGKLADVNAFSENVTVNINQKTTVEIESELASKLQNYLIEVESERIEDAIEIPTVKLPSADEALGLAGNELPYE